MISLRQLKTAGTVARSGSFSKAALHLNRTQSAVSRSVRELEQSLGFILFDRSSAGVMLTGYGERFLERFGEIEQQFAQLESAHRRLGKRIARTTNPVFRMEVSQRRLAAFLALHATGDIHSAAEALSVTRATVYGAIAHLERLLNVPLFEHSGARLTPSGFGQLTAQHLRLAFSLTRHLPDDLASIDGRVGGRLVIGTLPYSRTLLTPRAIDQVLKAHPALQIATREGLYTTLESALRSGEIDLIIGAIRPIETGDTLRTETLFTDELAVIAGAAHPLASKKRINLATTMNYGWILPVRRTPARRLFDNFLATHNLQQPCQVIESSSMSLIRGLLLESDRLALLSRHQIHYDEQAGLLKALPLRLAGTRRAIGLTTRAHTTPSPAQAAFMRELRKLRR